MPRRSRAIASRTENSSYTQKTGTPVTVPLPPAVIDALKDIPHVSEKYFFWSGNGDPETTVAHWQRGFRRLCELADVSGHFHMIRDTAAVGWLTKGVSLETVSILLGHSSIRITEKHYAPWVKSRQDMLEAIVRQTWYARSARPSHQISHCSSAAR
jgi:integrase